MSDDLVTPPLLRVKGCSHDWQVTVFELWQLAQYDCPARRVQYCKNCGRTESDWNNPYSDVTTPIPAEVRRWTYCGPFQIDDYDNQPAEFTNTLPEGMNPYSKEAVMIHWKQSYQH